MNILTVSERSTWFEPHIIGSLRAMGHSVTPYFTGAGVGEFYGTGRAAERHQKNADLLSLAQRCEQDGRLDLIFCYVYDDFLTEETAHGLRALGAPLVNYNVDMACQWYRQIRTAKYFTRMLCAQTQHMDALTRHGGRTFFFPMAACVPAQDTVPSGQFQPAGDVVFVGTPMAFRVRVLHHLAEAGVPLAVYGKFWRENATATPAAGFEKLCSDIRAYGMARLVAEGLGPLLESAHNRLSPATTRGLPAISHKLLKGFVPVGALAALFEAAPINLGFTRIAGDDPARQGRSQVKLRDFEVPAAGGFYLVEQAPDHERHFDTEREIVTWKSTGELLEKIHYYLAHASERRAIAEQGRQRALLHHTWPVRFASLFRELGIS